MKEGAEAINALGIYRLPPFEGERRRIEHSEGQGTTTRPRISFPNLEGWRLKR